ncbi:hypothetical protein BRADI_1g22077v3 [Brachypodium distachyon]|uniref:SRP54-type proteins GTP-binding domain-containing protein n=1 Tax=Brachypodium distachyon TaxID=15368 RepID=A0A0Q3NDS7_BRADI|nr:hypothetical protein BRADI_1g22077v3 [Brachypodium distachyon]
MLLPELSAGISRALAGLTESNVTHSLDEICAALKKAEVRPEMALGLRSRLDELVRLESRGDFTATRLAISQGLFHELCKVFHAGIPAFAPEKGKISVILFVGLKGSGKEGIAIKYGEYYKVRGFSPALVCAGRFTAGVLHESRRCAEKAGIPFHGSDPDCLKVAHAGLTRFKGDSDLIVVDVPARHEQEADLFDEMLQIAENIVDPTMSEIRRYVVGHVLTFQHALTVE